MARIPCALKLLPVQEDVIRRNVFYRSERSWSMLEVNGDAVIMTLKNWN